MEKWQDIPGCDGYQASNQGRIRSLKRFGYKILKGNPVRQKPGGWPSKTGKIVRVAVTIHKKRRQVHQLVLLTFRGPCPAGFEGCHNDGNAENNKLSNLRWDTHEENIADIRRHKNQKPHWSGRVYGRKFASSLICGIAGLI